MLNEINAIAMTYFHRCTIKRKSYVTDEWGSETATTITVAENLKCAVSKKDLPVLSDNGIQTYTAVHTLYTYPKTDIKSGDTIIAMVEGEEMTFTASRPFKYPSHIEVPITFEEVI